MRKVDGLLQGVVGKYALAERKWLNYKRVRACWKEGRFESDNI